MMVKLLPWAGATLIAGIALTVTLQTSRANTPLKHMGQAARNVTSVHLIGWSCDLSSDVVVSVNEGNKIPVQNAFPHRIEGWIKDGHWRETKDFDVTLYHRGKTWQNGKRLVGEKSPPLLSAFAFRAITGESPFGEGVNYTTRITEESLLDGQIVDKIVVDSEGADDVQLSRIESGQAVSRKILPNVLSAYLKPERRVFWVDKATYLPVRMEALHHASSRWDLDVVLYYEYNQPVSDALFNLAKVEMERYKPTSAMISAKDIYRLTPAQVVQWQAIGQDYANERERVQNNSNLSQEQKDVQLVAAGKTFQERVAGMMDPDQRKLWNEWERALDAMGRKVWTPLERKEDELWRLRQKKILDIWMNQQDEPAQQLLKGSSDYLTR